VEILTTKETNDIDLFLKSKEVEDEKEYYWIGLVDENADGEFTWTSTGSVPTYTNWYNGVQPSNNDNEYCTHLNYETHGRRTWNNRRCSESYFFALCQKGWSIIITSSEWTK